MRRNWWPESHLGTLFLILLLLVSAVVGLSRSNLDAVIVPVVVYLAVVFVRACTT